MTVDTSIIIAVLALVGTALGYLFNRRAVKSKGYVDISDAAETISQASLGLLEPLTGKVTALQSEVESLKEETVKAENSRAEELEALKKTYSEIAASSVKEMGGLSTQVGALQVEIGSLKEEILGLKSVILLLEEANRKLREQLMALIDINNKPEGVNP